MESGSSIVSKATRHLNQGGISTEQELQQIKQPGAWSGHRPLNDVPPCCGLGKYLSSKPGRFPPEEPKEPRRRGFKKEHVYSAQVSLSDLCLHYRDQPTLGNQNGLQ